MTRRESDYSRPTVRRRGMRTGYTTGACAAAAAKAATIALLSGEPVREVTIRLPIGKDATFQIHRCEIDGGDNTSASALCSVIKDGGDDPDVTSGAEIRARVWRDANTENDVTLHGGDGVGTVTKPGTGIPVGDPSITRVPRRLITQSVQEAAGGLSFNVEISVPGGQEIAKKTDNPRLGIVDGISILGTTGVVQPFSTAAWRASVNVSIDVAAANDLKHMVITTGTQSELFAKHWLGLEDMAYVNVGIFTGAALKRCVQRGIPRATLVGMIGKFSKIAMGKFVTHVAGNKVDPVFSGVSRGGVRRVRRRAGGDARCGERATLSGDCAGARRYASVRPCVRTGLRCCTAVSWRQGRRPDCGLHMLRLRGWHTGQGDHLDSSNTACGSGGFR